MFMHRHTVHIHTQDEIDAFQKDLSILLKDPLQFNAVIWANEGNNEATKISTEDLASRNIIEQNINLLRIKLLKNMDDFSIETIDKEAPDKIKIEKVVWDAFRGNEIVLEEAFPNGSKNYIRLGRISDLDVIRNFIYVLKHRQHYIELYYDYNNRLQTLINYANLENFVALTKYIFIHKKHKNHDFGDYFAAHINNAKALDDIFFVYSGIKQKSLNKRIKKLKEMNPIPGNNIDTRIQPSQFKYKDVDIELNKATKYFPIQPAKKQRTTEPTDALELESTPLPRPSTPPSSLSTSTSLDDLPSFVEALLQNPDFINAADHYEQETDNSSTNPTPGKKSSFL